MLDAEITSDGDVLVEGQHVGQLRGFRFTADPTAEGEAAKALNAAAQKALATEIEQRATRVHDAVDSAFALSNDGAIRWLGEPIAKISAGEKVLEPRALLIVDDQLAGEALEKVQRRVDLWLAQHVTKLLGPLVQLETGEGLEGIARGIAFRIGEELGVVERSRVAGDMKSLPQEGRAALRKAGIRFGAYHLYAQALLKPAPRALAAQLWALKHGGLEAVKGLEEVAHLASSGRTSFAANPDIPKDLYRVAGFRVCGQRAVRVDILERLADLIRPAVAYRPGTTPGDPPPGAADGSGFVVTVGMTSLAGCSGEAFASILTSLGFVMETRPGPAITVPLVPKAATEPLRATPPADDGEAHDPLAESPEGETSAADEAAAEGTVSGEAVLSAEQTEAEMPEAPGPDEVEAAAAEATAEMETPAEAVAEPETPQPAAELTDEAILAESALRSAVEETVAESIPPAHDDAGSEAASAEPAAPATIEVWSPGGRPHHRREGGHQRRGKPEKRAPREWIIPQRPERPQKPEGESEKREGRPKFEGKPRDGRPRDGKQRFEGRRDGRPPENRNERTFASSEKRDRERKPDPDSPFAKLLALKAELEKKK